MDGDEDEPDKIHHDEDGAGGPGTVSNHGLGRYVSPLEMHNFDDGDDDCKVSDAYFLLPFVGDGVVLQASSSVFLTT